MGVARTSAYVLGLTLLIALWSYDTVVLLRLFT